VFASGVRREIAIGIVIALAIAETGEMSHDPHSEVRQGVGEQARPIH